MKKILSILFVLIPFISWPQRQFDTTITAGGQTANVRMLWPQWYVNSHASTDSGQGIIYFVGSGQTGSNPANMRVAGPLNYSYNNHWNGGVQLGAITHYPFIMVVQQPTNFYQPYLMGPIIDTIMKHLPIMKKSLHLTGFSAGGWESMWQAFYKASANDFSYAAKFASIVPVQGVKTDDGYGVNDTWPGLVKFFPIYGRGGLGGKAWIFEQSNDGRGGQTVADTMNGVVVGSASFIVTTYSCTGVGVGGHGCEFNWYGDSLGTVPANYTNAVTGVNQNIYQWMLRQGDTLNDLHGNSPPNVSAGSNQTITLPTSSVSQTGGASGNNGATISSHVWSQVSGPNTATISSPLNYTSNFTGLIQGTYVFKLTATDNLSQSNFSQFTVIVNPAAVPYKHIGVIGSSTARGYFGNPPLYPYDSAWVGRLQAYYKSQNVIDTIYNLAQTSTNVANGAPSNFSTTYGPTYQPDTTINIKAIIKKNPTVVLVHYPTNGYDVMDITTIMKAFRAIKAFADSVGVPLYFVGCQPRGNFAPSEHQRILDVNDSLAVQYPNNFINYYDSVAIAPRSYTMNPIYWLYYPWGLQTTNYSGTAYADSVHMNAGGQAIVYRRVLAKGVFGGGKPLVFAGNAQTIQLPTSTITFSGTATAQNGTITSTTWSKVAGDNATITAPSSLTSTVTGLTWGNYVFKLKVVQSDGQSDSQYVRINVIPSCNQSAFVNYNLSTTAANEIYRPTNADYLGEKGGDTLTIPAGTYTDIALGHFTGDPCHYIYVRFAGPTTVGVLYIKDHSQYITFDGTNCTITGSNNTGVGGELSNHIEFKNFNIQHIPNGTGIIWKRVTDTTLPETIYPNYDMNKFYFHNNTINDIGGEGWYIGHTAPNGGDGQGSGIPVRMDSVEIAYNTTTNTDWDGIQLSNARYGCSIHDNIVYNYGRINMGSQQAGIIFGGNTNGNVYNNIVTKGTGNGIQVFGYDSIKVYNNQVDSAGMDLTTNGQATFFSNDPRITVENNPSQVLNINNNTILHPQKYGAIVLYNDNGTVGAGSVVSNVFCIPGALPNWQTTYLQLQPAGTVNSSNSLLYCSGAAAPVKKYSIVPGGKFKIVKVR